jgi:hypothetical protein
MLTLAAIGIRDWRLARAALKLSHLAEAEHATNVPLDRA